MIFACPLKELPDKFNMKTQKGVMPHGRYTESRYKEGVDSVNETMLAGELKESERQDFIDAIYQSKSFIRKDGDDIIYNMKQYALYYCNIDCSVLYHAITTFRK